MQVNLDKEMAHKNQVEKLDRPLTFNDLEQVEQHYKLIMSLLGVTFK